MSSQLDNPQSWATGSDPPTEKQTSFLQTLSKEKGVELDATSLNKGEASAKINELKGMDTTTSGAGSTTAGAAGGGGGVNSGAPIQDPQSWSTGDDPATAKQTGYIAVMAKEAGEEVKTEGLGKTEASERIGELKGKTGM